MKGFEELTHHAGITAWLPIDVYGDLVLDGVVCYGQLSGVVSAMEYDHSAGGGDRIQIRYSPARTASCASQSGTAACGCLSATSQTMGTYGIAVKAWGDYDLLCDFSLWTAKGNVKGMIINEMSKRLARCRDEEIWDNLSSDIGSPNIDIETDHVCTDGGVKGSCCTFSYNLYNSIVSAQKHLQGDAYEPDFVIMHPEVASYLYFKDGGGYHHSAMPQVVFDGKGQLTSIAGMTVIECCNANYCSGASGTVQAVVLDSRRAVGEVWGKRPKFEEQRVPDCDQTKLVVWMYWGSGILDPAATAWISNP